MTQKEKNLLLQDLCGRLPYGVFGVYSFKGNKPYDRELTGCLYDELYSSLCSTENSQFSPYLRPMSSMTKDEEKQFQDVNLYELPYTVEGLDWLNAHHFDYRGLTEKGLAIEAKEGMYD